jgi:hypothetical protein
MRSGSSARSVASMRFSLPRLTAAAGATAAVLAAASPALAADAVFGGTAKTGAPIVLKADPDTQQLRSIVLTWDAPCSDGRNYPGGGQLDAVEPVEGFSPGSRELMVSRNAKGRFAGVQLGSSDLGTAVAAVQVQLTGKLKPGRASGTLSAIAKVVDKATGNELTSCDTGKLSWVATRAPGIVYGGATSQGEPIVLRLNAQRKRVNDVLTTWNAPCGESGYFRAPDRFVNFAVKSTGRFGNPFSDDTTIATGAKRHFDYDIGGRVTMTSAKGTLKVKVTETDPAGVATNCDTGGVTWKAATG